MISQCQVVHSISPNSEKKPRYITDLEVICQTSNDMSENELKSIQGHTLDARRYPPWTVQGGVTVCPSSPSPAARHTALATQ
jgi:hypothetical protein